MKPGQEANGDNLGNVFDLRDKNYMLSVLIRMPHLMSTHKIQFHDKIKANIYFLELS